MSNVKPLAITGFGNCSSSFMSGFYTPYSGEKGIEYLRQCIEETQRGSTVNLICCTNSGQDAIAGEALRRAGFVAIFKAPGCHGGYQTFYGWNRLGEGQLAPQFGMHELPKWIVPVAEHDSYDKPRKDVGKTAFTLDKAAADVAAAKEVERLAKANAKLEAKLVELQDALAAKTVGIKTLQPVKSPRRTLGMQKLKIKADVVRKVARRRRAA